MSEKPYNPSRMMLGVVFAAGALAAGAAAWLQSTDPARDTVTCLGLTGGEGACRFIGGPLEVAGAPVFVHDRPQALFPTRHEITFIDAHGDTWVAPPQTLTDGASIPPIFTALMGDRQSREYLLAAAMHDAYCGIGNEALATYHTRPWHAVHRMFYEALLVNGTPPKKARVMYAAVFLGGPRWNDPDRSLAQVPDKVLVQELEWCLRWMDQVDPTPGEIEAWMTRREEAVQKGVQTEPDWDRLFADRA